MIWRKDGKKASVLVVIPKIIKRIKKLLNVLNFILLHSRRQEVLNDTDGNILMQIKHFTCEICEMVIERFMQAESVIGE